MYGFLAHCIYAVILILYVNLVYIQYEQDPSVKHIYSYLLIGVILYPAAYDFTQFYREGVRSYLSDMSNYFDMIYIWSGIINVIL